MGLSIGSGFEISSGFSFTPRIVSSAPTFNPTLLYTLDNPNPFGTPLNDFFSGGTNGTGVAISGNYAIISGYREGETAGTLSGKAYIYNITTGSLLRTLSNPNPYGTVASDNFGACVAISGNYAVVTAHQEDDASGTNSGKAYIFDVTTGNLLYTINNPNPYGTSQTDQFGQTLAMSGNYAVIGSYLEDDASGTDSGKVYVYDVTTGTLLRTISNPNPYGTSVSDYFGQTVSISDNYVVVGASQEDEASGTGSGKAYIFSLSTGSLLYTLNNPNAYDTVTGDGFGTSVATTDTYAIVSAPFEDEAAGLTSGKVYVFDVTTGSLLRTISNPNAYDTVANDSFGTRLAISGNYLLVSGQAEDDAGGTASGKAYIFDVTTGSLLYTFDNPNAYSTSLGDSFGYSISISGNYAIIGAYGEDDAGGSGSGKAYVYSLVS